MGTALSLAVRLRARQYAELLSDCLLRPGAAAREIAARPGHWAAGAAVGWLSMFLPFPDAPLFLRCVIWALCFALLCRPRAGSFRAGPWLVFWGYCLAPWTIARVFTGTIYFGFLRPMYPAGSHALPPQYMTAGVVLWFAMALIALSSLFAVLRLALNFARAAVEGSWWHAFGVWALALGGGYAAFLPLRPALALLGVHE